MDGNYQSGLDMVAQVTPYPAFLNTIEMDNGWIRLQRKMKDWRWYKEAKTLQLFINLLLSASHKESAVGEIVIERGQVLTSVKRICDETGMSTQMVRSRLSKLERTGEITKKSTNGYTVVTICNYDYYQGGEEDQQQTDNKRITNEQQTNNKRITTFNNDKNDKNDNNTPSISPPKEKTKKKTSPPKKQVAEFVTMTEDQIQKLNDEYGKEASDWMIDTLSNYKGSSGRKYKSDYHAIRNWVVERWNEHKRNLKIKNNSNGQGEVQQLLNVSTWEKDKPFPSKL